MILLSIAPENLAFNSKNNNKIENILLSISNGFKTNKATLSGTKYKIRECNRYKYIKGLFCKNKKISKRGCISRIIYK